MNTKEDLLSRSLAQLANAPVFPRQAARESAQFAASLQRLSSDPEEAARIHGIALAAELEPPEAADDPAEARNQYPGLLVFSHDRFPAFWMGPIDPTATDLPADVRVMAAGGSGKSAYTLRIEDVLRGSYPPHAVEAAEAIQDAPRDTAPQQDPAVETSTLTEPEQGDPDRRSRRQRGSRRRWFDVLFDIASEALSGIASEPKVFVLLGFFAFLNAVIGSSAFAVGITATGLTLAAAVPVLARTAILWLSAVRLMRSSTEGAKEVLIMMMDGRGARRRVDRR